MRVLIVLMGALGDVARGMALVNALKAHQPASEIAWVVEPKCEGIIRLHPQIDQVMVFERSRAVRALPALVRHMRAFRPQVTLDLQRHAKSGLLSWLSGAPRRIGFHRQDAKEGNWLFSTETIPHSSEEGPKLDDYLRFLTSLGVPVPPKLDFGLSYLDPATDAASHYERTGPNYVAFVMGSSWASKDWSVEGYQRLATEVLQHSDCGVVLIGDRSQQHAAAQLVAALPSGRIHDLVGRTTLREVVALLKGARCAVGPDSGPGHLAATVGCPYIALFGPTSARRTAPYGMAHLALQSPIGCAPCYRRRCPGLARVCMRGISAAQVFSRCKPFLDAGTQR